MKKARIVACIFFGATAVVTLLARMNPARGQAAQVVAKWDLMAETWKWYDCDRLSGDGKSGLAWPQGCERPTFDDSQWKTIDHLHNSREPQPDGAGKVAGGWYRKVIDLPTKVGEVDVSEARAFLVYTIDDYQETWIDGKKNIGQGFFTPWEIKGFNKPTVIDLSAAPYGLKPGNKFALAIFGLNGPIAAPYGGYWFRNCSIEFRK